MHKVLLVDDEILITKGLQVIIDWEKYGFEVVKIAENGLEALSYLKENTVHFLITDIMMPKMTGLELIKEAKEIQPALKCVILSGYQEFNFIKQGMKLGIENYLLKPVDESELLKTIQTISQKLSISPASNQNSPCTTLKDHTLWRLINHEIEKGEWQERLALYKIDFLKQYYSVSILHFKHEHQTKLKHHVRTHIETNYGATCFYSPDEELIIIFEADDKESLMQSNKDLHNHYLLDVCHEIGDFYLVTGNGVTSVEGLKDSYDLASELTLYEIALEPNQWITHTLFVDKEQLFKNQHESKKQVAKSMMGTKADIEKSVELFFDHLHFKESFVSHRVVRKYTLDLISYVHHSVQIDEYTHHSSSIERFFYATTSQEMISILKNYCSDLVDKISKRNNTRSPIVQGVLDYMHANYNKELSLKTLSQRFYVNPIYLGQLFQKELGMVFSEYINQYRLEKSKKLLKQTHLRAGDIGKQVGYADTTYFYKLFKRKVGATPTEWRNL